MAGVILNRQETTPTRKCDVEKYSTKSVGGEENTHFNSGASRELRSVDERQGSNMGFPLPLNFYAIESTRLFMYS